MGRRLAGNVLVLVWPRCDLTHPARIVLLRMAWQAHDSDDQPVYFGGWERLAESLGYGLEPKAGTAAQRAVTRALAELTAQGFVATDKTKPRHHKRRYELRIPGP